MILAGKSTRLEFGGWLVLLILQQVFHDLGLERCDDVCMKNMKMLILQYVFNDFGWKIDPVRIRRIADFVGFTTGF